MMQNLNTADPPNEMPFSDFHDFRVFSHESSANGLIRAITAQAAGASICQQIGTNLTNVDHAISNRERTIMC